MTEQPGMYSDLLAALRILAARPECVHGLNGPCRECGPSLSLDEAIAWQQELRDLDQTA
jgi:hypothetical protein